jgi:hypothetical protein
MDDIGDVCMVRKVLLYAAVMVELQRQGMFSNDTE